LRDSSNLRAWLLTIAHRKAIDAHRARARRPVPVAEPREAAAESNPGDPELWEQVRALPPKQRGAVVLTYVGDLPHADIARALRCSEDAARRSLHEGLAKLRKESTR
jgi:RNA polymerase sigma factor (sigma-70 family)